MEYGNENQVPGEHLNMLEGNDTQYPSSWIPKSEPLGEFLRLIKTQKDFVQISRKVEPAARLLNSEFTISAKRKSKLCTKKN